MAFYIVTMTHPDGPGWNEHVLEHVEYLLDLIDEGTLKASGPLKGTPLRAGFLIMVADSREEIEKIVAGDPFAREDLIVDLTIEEWDPLFGAFGAESSKVLPPDMKPLAARLGYE
ncbi:YciI family protein [Afifella marina]|uniref:YCII-related domain-containing protein n=1 Tax=Afifella marina DSM 2698 TaxID=1120955 RepID=A0A1G5MGM5_AFIMA|nr:YciI family protein [Afifella marina]MBK1625243.1 hypothetical protein [Afifella marina DSM 2698]MBK1628960.1 hypothetical protein [Afifella marina]MBK5918339.1 hypothetical protein [Afifella marina]RAI22854.1 hypothetical protein CH311_04175 [Afifella marina DSM 2698]SCZ23668.1 hypothetical protein SAMN03080610_00582 [Afifella marina DSM 2698]